MSNTLFALLGSLAPIRELWKMVSGHVALPARKPAAHTLGSRHAGLPAAFACAGGQRLSVRDHARMNRRAYLPLRVVRIVETGQTSHSGRMMISGRMADVCAELDRMVERESSPRLGV